MYVPRVFAEVRQGAIAEVLRRWPLALLVTQGDGGLLANHVPLLHDPGAGTLRGHVARANPQAEHLLAGAEALAVFQGPNAYISPAWYVTTPNVPTWSYVAVHVTGRARPLAGHDAHERLLRDMVAAFEGGRWSYDRLPPSFAADLMPAIQGFEIPIERMEAKSKLGQNRERVDREGAVAGLRQAGDPASLEVAALMEALLEP